MRYFSSDYIDYNGGWIIEPGIVNIGDQESLRMIYRPWACSDIYWDSKEQRKDLKTVYLILSELFFR